MLDIVIPVLNEEKILKDREDYFQTLSRCSHLIFVDGGSKDETVALARNLGSVVESRPGRGYQKNAGAKEASSAFLLFLHVDTIINTADIEKVHEELANGSVVGCFTMNIDDKRHIFRLYEELIHFRLLKFGVIDGDLGMFIRRDAFEGVGNFDDIRVMEDIAFGRKIRGLYQVKQISNRIHVSSRRWEEEGFIKTFILYMCHYIKFWIGKLKS